MLTLEGKIINNGKIFRGRIEIDQSGTISKIGSPTGDADFVFKEELIFPGFIDLHVHAREDTSHTQDYKEDFVSAGEAAIAGGVVAFLEMPNNPIPPVDDESYEKKNILAKKSPVEIFLYAGIGPNTKPLSKKVPYKAYMGPSVGDLYFKSQEELEKVIADYAGQNVSFHCEDPEILEANKGAATHEERRPPEAELSAVDFALKLIEKYDLGGKICHASTKIGIEKIKVAKDRGLRVTAEVSPHHLYFDAGMLPEENPKWMQMNPPLRNTEDRLFLIEALRGGVIDYLATDHAPHTKEEKLKGTSGTPQLDTYGLIASWLMKNHGFSPGDISRVASFNHGNFINQFTLGKYGKIEEGYSGSLAVLDLDKPTVVTESMLKTKAEWSTYQGVTFPGRVVMTIVKGKILKNEIN